MSRSSYRSACLERRLDVDVVDRADLAVRSDLGGIRRIDFGAELHLDSWPVAALHGHGDGALAAQLARDGTLLIGAGRGHVLEADIDLCAGAVTSAGSLSLSSLPNSRRPRRDLHLRRGGGPEAAPITLDGLDVECRLAVSAARGERLCLARRSSRLSPRCEGHFHQAILAAPAERAFEFGERLRMISAADRARPRLARSLGRRLRGRSQVRPLDVFAAPPPTPVALEHRLASTLNADGRGALGAPRRSLPSLAAPASGTAKSPPAMSVTQRAATARARAGIGLEPLACGRGASGKTRRFDSLQPLPLLLQPAPKRPCHAQAGHGQHHPCHRPRLTVPSAAATAHAQVRHERPACAAATRLR